MIRPSPVRRLLQKANRFRRALTPPSKIRQSIRAARDPESIIVRWQNVGIVKDNWGDKLNLPIVEKISGRQVFNFNDVVNVCQRPAYSVIGSGLGRFFADADLVVWGTGFIWYDMTPVCAPKRICAVRGPLSRKKYLDAGIPCPEVYGDPALLCPKYWRFDGVEKKYKVGFIPQCMDKELPIVSELADRPNVKVIDIFASIEQVLKDILSCEAILSSSLHGLVAADAYGVPSLWLRLSEKPLGDLFKFQDFYASIGLLDARPAGLQSPSEVDALAEKCVAHDLEVDLEKLMEVCPFAQGS